MPAVMKIRIEVVNCRKWILDEDTGAGVEITVRERKGYDLIQVETTNRSGLPNRVEEFRFYRLTGRHPLTERRSRVLRRKIDKAFAKIAHRYREWGVPEEKIRFPWKEDENPAPIEEKAS